MRLRPLVLIPLLPLILNCAKPKVVMSYIEPPRFYSGDIRKIAVLPLESRTLDGRLLASEIEAQLLQVRVKGRPYFRVVSRTEISKVLSELKFSSSGLTEDQVELGRLLKAEGILTGTAEYKYEVSYYLEIRTVCLQTKGSGIIKECVKTVKRRVPCQLKRVEVLFLPKLVDVEKGEVVYSRKIVTSAQDKYCADYNHIPQTSIKLLSRAKAKAIEELIRDIAPHRVYVQDQFMDDEEGVKEKELFKRAIDLAKDKKVERACSIFNQIASETYAVLYNRALCAELRGDLSLAQELYRRSLSLKDEERIRKALERVRFRRLKEVELRNLVK